MDKETTRYVDDGIENIRRELTRVKEHCEGGRRDLGNRIDENKRWNEMRENHMANERKAMEHVTGAWVYEGDGDLTPLGGYGTRSVSIADVLSAILNHLGKTLEKRGDRWFLVDVEKKKRGIDK